MATQIPFTPRADFQFELPLDRVVFLLRLRWNELASSWAMDILTRARTPLVYGTRLVPGVPLLAEHAMAQRPAGEFYVFGTPNTFDAFTTRAASLYYYTAREMGILAEQVNAL